MIKATLVPILQDNYAWLLRDEESGCTAIVDPAEVDPVVAAIDAAGGKLDLILLTHHHGDHIAGTDAIRARYGAKVVGAKADAHRLPKLDREVSEGSEVDLGASTARVFETPGHTRGHISYYFADGHVLLCGDTLFSLGCGQLFEGTPAQMLASLDRLAALPDATAVCCAHEYTASNAAFALTVDPDNTALQARASAVRALRSEGRPTLPSTIALERATNPFLRCDTLALRAAIAARLGRAPADRVETFAELRRWKDGFRA
jgi:hydroxyacylglutathione hydrolase